MVRAARLLACRLAELTHSKELPVKRRFTPCRRPAPVAVLTAASALWLACQSPASSPDDTAEARQAASKPAPVTPGPRPIIDALSVELLKTPLPDANARLLATVSPASATVIAAGGFLIQPDAADPKRDVAMRDDGKGADDTAGDLVFSGYLTWDFNELLRQNNRVTQLGGGKAAEVTTFNGRVAGTKGTAPIVDPKQIVPGKPIAIDPVGIALAISVPHSLIINDPGVVGDPVRTFDRCSGSGTPMGPWTFGHLFSEMINQPLTGVDPNVAALKWLDTWNHNQELHFNSALPRNVNPFIQEWQNRSGTKVPKLELAPFQLVAIVNRMDLHESVGYSEGNAGELRFVFALEDANCNPLPMLVIFEYGNLPQKCDPITDLAVRWVDLANHPLGSPAYNALLQGLTDEVVTANAAPLKVNRSALNQLRTNDFVFDRPWQLREFILHKSGLLVPETVKRTPDEDHEDIPAMRAGLAFAIDNNLPSIWPNPPASMPNMLTGSFDPLEFPAGFFIRAMASDIPHPGFCFTPPLSGNAAISGFDARFEYSSNTCSGCHGGDLNSSGNFTHIDEHGNLSAFLSGPMTAPDCTFPSFTRDFDEPTRRAQVLDALATNSCVRLAALSETKAEH